MKPALKKTHSNWRPFEEARAFARTLGLRSEPGWRRWAKTPDRPQDIPAAPNLVYNEKGWVSWGDWLGTDRIAHQKRTFLPFREARAFVHTLPLDKKEEWREWAKRNAQAHNIPANPQETYKGQGWISWGDWLGTGTVANSKRSFLPFEEAREFVRKLGFESVDKWRAWTKTDDRPANIPTDPYRTYKNDGWIDFGDWLGRKTGSTTFKRGDIKSSVGMQFSWRIRVKIKQKSAQNRTSTIQGGATEKQLRRKIEFFCRSRKHALSYTVLVSRANPNG